jgi:hypothetical protein
MRDRNQGHLGSLGSLFYLECKLYVSLKDDENGPKAVFIARPPRKRAAQRAIPSQLLGNVGQIASNDLPSHRCKEAAPPRPLGERGVLDRKPLSCEGSRPFGPRWRCGGRGMDAFEHLVSEILWEKGFWVRTSVKVDLTKEDKLRIGKLHTPRWEIDIVAYSGRDNVLRVVECKSFIDSGGVSAKFFRAAYSKPFKLFTDDTLRETVRARLIEQFVSSGACKPEPKVILCFAAGHIAGENDRAWIRNHFDENKWELWDETWLIEGLTSIAANGYANQVSSVVAKLFINNKVDCAATYKNLLAARLSGRKIQEDKFTWKAGDLILVEPGEGPTLAEIQAEYDRRNGGG